MTPSKLPRYAHRPVPDISCEPADCAALFRRYGKHSWHAFLQYAKQLADDLREKIKALGYDRHKLVVQVRMVHSTLMAFACCVLHLKLVHASSLAGHPGTEERPSYAGCF